MIFRKVENLGRVYKCSSLMHETCPADIYDPSYVRRLFDEMSGTYGVVNVISSLGFCVRWRRQCVGLLSVRPGSVVVDLMTGMGELCPQLARLAGANGHITAVDLSPECVAERAP